jgi:hypothetical protein
MRIFLCASKWCYDRIPPIKAALERAGHVITPPNCYDQPMLEEEQKKLGAAEHSAWKAGMIRLQEEKILQNDAILVLNFEKKGVKNYIGGATFLEIFQAWRLGKKVYLYNPIPEGIFSDELMGMAPTIINGDLALVR